MAYQVLARKWRPRHFEEVVGQTHVVRALSNALQQQYLHHAYLLTGTRGVGKTTIARLLAKCLNCEQGISATPCDQCECCREIDEGRFIDLFEVDAASRTKVEDTRELLENVPYAPTKGRYKVYLIDEVHMLSGHSFNALLKTLEEPPEHVKFLLATTDPQKLPPTVLSRCLQFHLLAMPAEQISQHLQHILAEENISFEAEAITLLSKAANGSMRDALSLLDQSIAYGNGKVVTSDVSEMLGTIDQQLLTGLIQALQQQDGTLLLKTIDQLHTLAVDFNRALADLLALLHQIAVSQLIPDNAATSSEITTLAQQLNAEDVQLYYQIGLIGQRDLSFAPTPRIGFEMTLLRMMAFMPQLPGDTQQSNTNTHRQTSQPKTTTNTTAAAPAVPVTNTQATTPKPQTVAPKSEAQTTPTDPTLTSTADWHNLLPKLDLQGVTLMLAQHCQLQQVDDDATIQLLLHSKHKPLLQNKHTERINAKLTDYFKKPHYININIVNDDIETSALISKRDADQRQQAAEETIENDPFVQRLKQQFDAKVLKESITIN